MSSPNWNPHGFAHDYTGDSRTYVRRARRPPPTAEPNTGALWEAIHVRLEPEDSARMAWASVTSNTRFRGMCGECRVEAHKREEL